MKIYEFYYSLFQANEYSKKYTLRNKIDKLVSLVNSINEEPYQEVCYSDSSNPNIIVSNNSLIGKSVNTLTELYQEIADNVNRTNNKLLVALLQAAGDYHILLPTGYPIKMTDLDYTDIIRRQCALGNSVDFSKYVFDVTDLYIYINNSGEIPKYWYKYYITITEYKFDANIKPVQSIQIDSSINYELCPSVLLNYKKS